MERTVIRSIFFLGVIFIFPYFVLFNRVISMYGIMAIVGIFVAGYLFTQIVKKNGYDVNDALVFLLYVGTGIIIGGHILFGITKISEIHLILEVKNFKEFTDVIVYLFGGSVFFGGLIGGAILGTIYSVKKKLPYRLYTDVMSFCAPLFHSFGRIGCFLGGCCYGIESEFGFTAHNNPWVKEINEISRFPVQLLESIANLILFSVFFVIFRKKQIKGPLFPLYLSSYSVVRFFDEFLRGDSNRGIVLWLSTSQFISIIAFVAGVVTFLYFNKIEKAKNI